MSEILYFEEKKQITCTERTRLKIRTSNDLCSGDVNKAMDGGRFQELPQYIHLKNCSPKQSLKHLDSVP